MESLARPVAHRPGGCADPGPRHECIRGFSSSSLLRPLFVTLVLLPEDREELLAPAMKGCKDLFAKRRGLVSKSCSTSECDGACVGARRGHASARGRDGRPGGRKAQASPPSASSKKPLRHTHHQHQASLKSAQTSAVARRIFGEHPPKRTRGFICCTVPCLVWVRPT